MSWIQVLVASSDVEERITLAKILAECGLTPLMASSLEDVRAVLSQRAVQLVFCEDNLAGGTFREVLGLAKAAKPMAQVVVSCRWGELEEYLEAMQLGAFDFIVPPYRGAEIVSIVYGVWKDYCAQGGEHDALLYSGRSVAAARQGDNLRP